MENIKFVLAEILSPLQINAETRKQRKKRKTKNNVEWVSEKTRTVGEAWEGNVGRKYNKETEEHTPLLLSFPQLTDPSKCTMQEDKCKCQTISSGDYNIYLYRT